MENKEITSPEQLEKFVEELKNTPFDLSNLPHFSESSIETLYSLGYQNYEKGLYDNAIKIFQILTTIDPYSRKHWMGLGATYQMSQQYLEAIKAYGFAAMLDENDPYTHLHAAECFFAMDNIEQGHKALRSAEIVSQKDDSTVISAIAQLKERWKTP